MASKKNKKDKWFTSVRGSYLPRSSAGWLTYIPYFTFLLFSFILVWELNINQVVKVYLVLIQWAFAGLFMTWIAKTKS
jgi:hypothetical protein